MGEKETPDKVEINKQHIGGKRNGNTEDENQDQGL